jgi:uncharacterized protein YpuA (DUF1002 family)
MNVKECAKNYNLELTEEQIQEIEKVMRRFENKINYDLGDYHRYDIYICFLKKRG